MKKSIMSLKDMVIRLFEPKKYKIIRFGKVNDKEEIYLVQYRPTIFSNYDYLIRNDISNITEATLEGDNFSPRIYVRRELRRLNGEIDCDKIPFSIYKQGIKKLDRLEVEQQIGSKFGHFFYMYSTEKCEEIIENHKEVMKLAKIIKKEERQIQKTKYKQIKNSKPKIVKRH